MLQNLKHEIQVLMSKPLIFIVLIGASSAYALLIGNLYRPEILQNIPVAVCDLDDSPLSRELIHAVMDADQYEYRQTLHDSMSYADLLESGEVAAVLVIPYDFSKRFYYQQPIELAFIQDGSNVMQSSYTLPPMQLIIGQFAAKFSSQTDIANGTPQLSATPVSMSLRTFGNPTQSYLEFYVYGVMLMAAQLSICVAFSLSLHSDLNNHSQFSLPIKEIFYLILSLISVLIAVFFIYKVFDLPFIANPFQIFMLCAAFLFCVENLAGLAALYLKTQTSLIQCVIFYTLPAFLLSGYIWSDIAMIDVIHFISMLLPVHYILSDFRSLALVGYSQNYIIHTGLFLFVALINYLFIQHKKIMHRLTQD